MLTAPWNYVGLGIALVILLGVAVALGVIVSKLGFGPTTKPLPEAGVRKHDARAALEAAEEEARINELASRPEPKKWGAP